MTALTAASGMVTKVIEDLVTKEGKTYDHCVAIGPMIMMKFCMSDHKEAWHPDHRQHEPDHGRRNRYVRSLSCDRRR